jgi:hypothetical protein
MPQVRNGHIKRITDNDIQSLVIEIVGTNVSTTYITCPADPGKTLGIKLPFLVMIIKNLKKYFTFEVQVRSPATHTRPHTHTHATVLVYTHTHTHTHRPVYLGPCYADRLVVCGFVAQVLDDKNVRRRFRASNYQSATRVKPFICTMPMRLDDGWNQIQVGGTLATAAAASASPLTSLLLAAIQFNLSDFTRRAYGTNYIETLRVQVGADQPTHTHTHTHAQPFLFLLCDGAVSFGPRSTPTAASAEYTSRTGSTPKRSSRRNSSFTSL